MTSAMLNADTPALLNREIDDLLLHMRGLAVVRDILSSRGASSAEIMAHTQRARVGPLAADRADQRHLDPLDSRRPARCEARGAGSVRLSSAPSPTATRAAPPSR